MDNNKYKCNQIKAICENKLNIEFSKKSKEFNGWYHKNGKGFARVTIPHGRKNAPKGTYKSMAHQLLLEISEFDLLLYCTLKNEDYLKITANRNIMTFKK
jgi:hypothetical protein